MKSVILVGCLALFVSGCSSTGEVAGMPEEPWTRSPVIVPFAKVVRGTGNIVRSPFEVPATVVRVSREYDNLGYGLAAGLPEGIVNGCVRLGAGVVEILTFPLVYDGAPLYDRDLGERAFHRETEPIP